LVYLCAKNSFEISPLQNFFFWIPLLGARNLHFLNWLNKAIGLKTASKGGISKEFFAGSKPKLAYFGRG
jgi:hypothetical protein